jgi:hypothetical protein
LLQQQVESLEDNIQAQDINIFHDPATIVHPLSVQPNEHEALISEPDHSEEPRQEPSHNVPKPPLHLLQCQRISLRLVAVHAIHIVLVLLHVVAVVAFLKKFMFDVNDWQVRCSFIIHFIHVLI